MHQQGSALMHDTPHEFRNVSCLLMEDILFKLVSVFQSFRIITEEDILVQDIEHGLNHVFSGVASSFVGFLILQPLLHSN